MDNLCAVVHCLGHARSRRVDILTPSESSLDRETLYRKRNLESELHTHVALIDTAHGEVSERVLRVIVEAHHVCLIHDLCIESCHAHIVTVAAILVVQVGRDGLHCLEVRYKRVSCTRRDE